MYNKQHLSNILAYIGIGFISGSISHGVFSQTRSVVTALIGVILFIISELLKEEKKSYVSLFVYGLLYSVSIGMVSGGLQHFLDSPERSLWIVPVGFVASLLVFPRKEKLTDRKRRQHLASIGLGLIIGGVMYAGLYTAYHRLPATVFSTDHHSENVGMPKRMHGLSQEEIQSHCTQMPNMEGCETPRGYPPVSGSAKTGTVSKISDGQLTTHTHSMNHGDMVTSEFDFIALMIPHHQEAVDTSIRLGNITQNPFYSYLTNNIIKAQQSEIAMMQGRLNERYSGIQYTGMAYMPMMRDTSTLSAIASIERIRTEDMIIHHQGAVDMANKVLTLNPRKDVREFALAVIRDQSQEIELMKQQLQLSNTSNTENHTQTTNETKHIH